MSRARVMTLDERGRPKAAWEPAPELERVPVMFEPANPPGPIERRYVAPEEPVRRRERTPLTSPERLHRSRMNGARRHIEVVTARRPKEEPVMASDPDPVMEPTALERLAAAAQMAHTAHEDKQVADEAWAEASRAEASRALTIAWRDLPAEFLDMAIPPFSPPTPAVVAEDPQPRPASEPPPNIPETIPPRTKGPSGLTPRQTAVLEGLRAGKDRKAIAAELGVVYQTVDGILEAMAKKGLLPIEYFSALPARFARWAAVRP